jgi:aspartyl-tRNA(Asn)/glutamyl-tRNA(Gln) amidotransferase subunit A
VTATKGRPSALRHLTLVQASDAVRKGEVSSVALTEAALEAFKAGDPTINASIALDTAEALETAEGLDRLRKAGRLLGSLHGVPLVHKDMYYRQTVHVRIQDPRNVPADLHGDGGQAA